MAPSSRHIELQNMLSRWITNRSFKQIMLPECNAVGYIADFVAIAGMNNAEHTKYTNHSGLKKMYMRPRFNSGTGNVDYTVEGDVDRNYCCVFEVKISRADFLNTFGGKDSGHAKSRLEPVGTAHWIVADKGVCKPTEVPLFWGLLEPYGAGLTEKKMPKLNALPESTLHAIAFEMMWAQMNYRSSYYDQLRDMSDKIKMVHQAIRHEKPNGELRRVCNQAVQACRGFI